MAISLEAIVTGMNGGPEAIQQNFNKIKTELERMNGSVVEIPKEQFTTLNGFSVDRNACKGLVFKFDSFAIIYFQSYIGNVTLKGWTFKEALAIPKSYLGGFTKFAFFGVDRRISDDAKQYDVDFKPDKAAATIYTRGSEWNNGGMDIKFAGILYN